MPPTFQRLVKKTGSSCSGNIVGQSLLSDGATFEQAARGRRHDKRWGLAPPLWAQPRLHYRPAAERSAAGVAKVTVRATGGISEPSRVLITPTLPLLQRCRIGKEGSHNRLQLWLHCLFLVSSPS